MTRPPPLRLAGVRASSSRFTPGLGVNGAERDDEEPEPDNKDAVILGAQWFGGGPAHRRAGGS